LRPFKHFVGVARAFVRDLRACFFRLSKRWKQEKIPLKPNVTLPFVLEGKPLSALPFPSASLSFLPQSNQTSPRTAGLHETVSDG
jgi:hypothetical protein